MWVLKLGGSLGSSPELRAWLGVLASQGRGRVVVVPGGGAFADAVRSADAQWPLPPATSHRMALLAMAQYGLMLSGLAPWLTPARSRAAIRGLCAAGRTPVWLPTALIFSRTPEIEPSWRVTSDSLAAWLAGRLGAASLILVKSVPRPVAGTTIADLERDGIVDPAFARHVSAAGCEVYCLGPGDAPELARALRLAEPCGTRIGRSETDGPRHSGSGAQVRARGTAPGPAAAFSGGGDASRSDPGETSPGRTCLCLGGERP